MNFWKCSIVFLNVSGRTGTGNFPNLRSFRLELGPALGCAVVGGMGQNVGLARAVVGLHAISHIANRAAGWRHLILVASLGLLALLTDFQAAQAQPSGGTISTVTIDGIRYRVHTFTSSGTLHVDAPLDNVEYLVVAGGGGGDRGRVTEDGIGGSWGDGGGGG